MIKKNFKRALNSIVEQYFKGQFESSFGAMDNLSQETLSYEQEGQLKKILSIFF